MRSLNKSLLAISVASASLLFSACSSDSNTSTTSNTSNTSGAASGADINRSVFASYVNGASVVVKDESGNTVAGPVTTNASGEFSLKVPHANLTENLIFTATGGQYRDEATGSTTSNTSLSARLAADSLSSSASPQLALSPESTIINTLVNDHSLTLETARSRFESAFGYAFDGSVIPVDATEANGSAEQAQILAGLRAATFSQLTNDLGLPASSQSALLALLAEDIADGDFDGQSDSQPLSLGDFNAAGDLQNRFSQALVNFRNGNDATGLNNAQIGVMPFSKIAISDSYIVTYHSEAMMIKNGKSQFQLVITDKQGQAATGLTPMLMPMMHMAMHNHSTPKLMITESNTPGTYDVTVYYVMASVMGNGGSMGYWDLKIMIGEEEVHFFPKVMMAMGDTVHARLRGQDDSMPNMSGGSSKRPYEIFRNDLTIDENGADFSVFISTRESMMSFPALTNGLVLNAGSDYELNVNTVTVEMSVDETNWTNATIDGNGFWSADDLPISNDGSAQSIYVKLSVNGEQKTDDGSAPDGTADNAEFQINSSSMMEM